MKGEASTTWTLVVGLEAMNASTLLREFDAGRRALALELHGLPGAFGGFDRLHFNYRLLDLLAAGDEITIKVFATSDSLRRTHARFQATFSRVTAGGWRTDAEVANGQGVIVYGDAGYAGWDRGHSANLLRDHRLAATSPGRDEYLIWSQERPGQGCRTFERSYAIADVPSADAAQNDEMTAPTLWTK